jgi:hypothetical protein
MPSKLLSWLLVFTFASAFVFDAAAQTPPPAAPAAATAQPPGRIRLTRVVGQVTVEDIATKAVQPGTNDMEITQGSIVHTQENSSVVLVFSNGATVNLAFNSDLNIEQFTQDPFSSNYEPAKATEEPTGTTSTTSIKLTRGELVGNVKKLHTSAGSKFTVGTPVGAAGIRGTTFRIVYRPTGNGQAFNFVLTTIEGNVEVTLATGTVTLPVSVTDNKEVVINNVEVNPTTNEITVTTGTGQTTTVTAPPPATDAPVTTVQQVQAVAQQIAQAVADVVIPATPANTNTNTGGTQSGTGNTSGDSNNSNNSGNNSNSNDSGNSNNSNSNNSNNSSNTNNSGTSGNSNPPPGNNFNSGGSNSPGNTTQIPRNTPGAGGS